MPYMQYAARSIKPIEFSKLIKTFMNHKRKHFRKIFKYHVIEININYVYKIQNDWN